MSAPSFSTPVLSYVGSVDIASSHGTTMYNILFDPSMTTLGRVLMFEYKFQPSNVAVVTPSEITLGYVNVEQAIFTAGIANQYTIAVPAANNIYDPSIALDIQVRVYSGLTTGGEIAVSSWSNALAVHNPPPEPVIRYATWDKALDSGEDDLWIVLQNDPSYNLAEIKFLVAYYFQSEGGVTTSWSVSDALTGELITDGSGQVIRLLVNQVGSVMAGSTMYVAAYAVFPFMDGGNEYYSVSHVSATVSATQNRGYAAPVITDINYLVYDPSRQQIMEVTWIPPENSILPTFTVDHYQLESQLAGDTSWTVLDANIASDELTYSVDVSSYSCGDQIFFRVRAVSTEDIPSPYSASASEKYFLYSQAPQNLAMGEMSYDSANAVMTVQITFKNPSSVGCGVPTTFYATIYDSEGNAINSDSKNYVDGSGSYFLTFSSDTMWSSTGSVELYLNTQDNNQTRELAGASAFVDYVCTSPVLDPVTYEVYGEGQVQQMDLFWSPPENSLDNSNPFVAASYTVYYRLSGATSWTSVPDLNLNWSLDVSDYSCGDVLDFKVVAVPSSGPLSLASNVENEEIFYYASAPSSVSISDCSLVGSTGMSFTVNVSQPTAAPAPDIAPNGCGTPVWYVANVYNSLGALIVSQSVSAVTDPSNVTITFTNITQSDTGYVDVYLQTYDTNSESTLMNGAIATAYYAATAPVLEPLDYLVYTTTDVDQQQKIVVSWTAPGETFIVDHYTVNIYNSITELTDSVDTENTTITYNVDSIACGTALTFTVVAYAIIPPDTVLVSLVSNSETINIFVPPTQPVDFLVEWAVVNIDSSSNTMVMKMYFENPLSVGCYDASGSLYFTLRIYSDGNPTVPIYTRNVTYDPLATSYDIEWSDVPIIASGLVSNALYVKDTNSSSMLPGAFARANFASTDVPVYKNVEVNPAYTVLSFRVESAVPLDVTQYMIATDVTSPEVRLQWSFSSIPNGVNDIVPPYYSVSRLVLESGVYEYRFTFYAAFFGMSTFPDYLSVYLSNNAGISIHNFQNQPI